MIQQIRILKAAVKMSHTLTEWKRLKLKHALIAYSDLDSESSTQSDRKKQEFMYQQSINAFNMGSQDEVEIEQSAIQYSDRVSM